jgi:formiminotetrahydrofolate cyclodeaminase
MNIAELELLIPILIFGGGIVIALVAIFSAHQRKMAEIIHGGARDELYEDLRQEVDELKAELRAVRSQLPQKSDKVVEQRLAEEELHEGTPPPSFGG